MKVTDEKNLNIYIANGCFVCSETPKIVKEIRSRFPNLNVNLIDINENQKEIPDSVFSVPTYTLKGKTISLGNPNEDFFDKLEKLLQK